MTSELVVAEDYLILDRLSTKVELAFLQDLAEGTFVSDCLTRADIERARSLVESIRSSRSASRTRHSWSLANGTPHGGS